MVSVRRKSGGPSGLEASFAVLWGRLAKDAPQPVTEHPFAASIGRRWRFDFAWPDATGGVAVELEGAVYRGGRGGGTAKGGHSSATGIQRDIEKGNAANDLGWVVYRYTVKDLRERPVQVIEQVRRAIERRAGDV